MMSKLKFELTTSPAGYKGGCVEDSTKIMLISAFNSVEVEAESGNY